MPSDSPWMDQSAPPQWVMPMQSPPNPVVGQVGAVVNQAAQDTGFDTTLHWKVSGTIIIALVVIFGLQMMGFRFVVAANTSFGIGKS